MKRCYNEKENYLSGCRFSNIDYFNMHPQNNLSKMVWKTPNDNPIDTNKEYQTIFVVDEKNKLVGLRVPVEEIEEDQIASKMEFIKHPK